VSRKTTVHGYYRAINEEPYVDGTWLVSRSELLDLYRAGAAVVNSARSAKTGKLETQVAHLESVVDRIAGADVWWKRLGSRMVMLRSARAKDARKRLVKRGCVPDELFYCLEAQEQQMSQSLASAP